LPHFFYLSGWIAGVPAHGPGSIHVMSHLESAIAGGTPDHAAVTYYVFVNYIITKGKLYSFNLWEKIFFLFNITYFASFLLFILAVTFKRIRH
jgi:hypothetical protein